MDINMLSNCSWFIQISNIELNARSNGNIYADIPEQTDDEDGEDNRHEWTAFVWTCYYGQKDDVQLFVEHSDRIELNEKN